MNKYYTHIEDCLPEDYSIVQFISSDSAGETIFRSGYFEYDLICEEKLSQCLGDCGTVADKVQYWRYMK